MNKEAFDEALKIAPDSDIENLLQVVRRYREETYDLLSRWIATTPRQFLEILRQFVDFDRIVYKNNAVDLFPALVAERTGDLLRRTLTERLGEAAVADLPAEELLYMEQECALDPKRLASQIAMFKRIGIEGVIDVLIEEDREWVIDFIRQQNQHDKLFARANELPWIIGVDAEKEEAILILEEE